MLEEARLQLEASENKYKSSDGNQIICECMCVSLEMIREFCINNEVDLSKLKQEYGLGSSCSSRLKSYAQWSKWI